MSARDGEPDVPEETPRPDDDSPAEDPATAGSADEETAPEGAEGEGEVARPRRRRARIALVVAAALALIMVAVVAVPTTRNGLLDLWCDVTGGVCPGEPLPPITEDEEVDWRVRVEPEEAALWGNYVALGDSYSSGDGAGDYDPLTAEPGECWRSENAYPRLIEEEFPFEGSLAFYACSSHRGSQMLEQLGTPESQLERVTEHTSLVTLGIGGNDLGFIPVLRTCIMRMPLLERTACTDQESEVDERMDRFEKTLTEVLGEIRDRAPDARVLVLGYPRLFPEDPPGMYYTLSANDQLWLNGLAERFNDRIRDTVYRADGEVYGARQVGSVEFVNVFSSLSGHEVSEDDAWLNGIVLGQIGEGLKVDRASFHPTAQGQRSIAERVRLQIAEGPERVLYQSKERLEKVDPDVLTRELGGPLDPVHPEDGDEGDGDEVADEASREPAADS
ncbi:SGNH/GDSL hydrolase family protein [Nocardiopsis alba]|uniref:SGNH/GDSL hydrolase family protein n=2 Tax=Nocardiopsis alba TaxID=53437 RepID=A0ABV5DT90_9ACTN|nr:SGNH/GDSL hydrolase family protein [Nocardiopsis alba]AFR06192.1 GDSL-like Lipase/Acylhydrolase family protein [Nocardiopsis alba ATCC BAA-2165]